MTHLNEELLTYLRNHTELLNHVAAKDISNEFKEKYQNFPTIVYKVQPYTDGQQILNERHDTIKFWIIDKMDSEKGDKCADILRQRFKRMMNIPISTFQSATSTWLNGREKCVILHSEQENSPEYESDSDEGIYIHIQRYRTRWQDNSL